MKEQLNKKLDKGVEKEQTQQDFTDEKQAAAAVLTQDRVHVSKNINGAFAICSSHIRQGDHQNASALAVRLFV